MFFLAPQKANSTVLVPRRTESFLNIKNGEAFVFGRAEQDIGQETNLDTFVSALCGLAVMVFCKSLLGIVPALLCQSTEEGTGI